MSNESSIKKQHERVVILDTETTGFSPKNGDRMIEIAAIEMINRTLTGNNYHVYINPLRDIPEESTKVHGLTLEDVIRAGDGKTFPDIADEFLAFIGNDELIIHNAPFDVGFLDYELEGCGKRKITGNNPVFDTLKLANHLHPQKRNNLDALAKRFNITSFNRDYHGALVDSEILAQVFLQLTNKQHDLGVTFDEPVSQETVAIEKFYGHSYKMVLADFTDDMSP